MLEFETGTPDLVNVSATDKKSEGAENKKSEIAGDKKSGVCAEPLVTVGPSGSESSIGATRSLVAKETYSQTNTKQRSKRDDRLATLKALDARHKELFPAWRSLSIRYRMRFIQLALQREAARSRSFTLNFDPSVADRMRRCKKTFSTTANAYIREALKPIEERYGIHIPYWFVIESSRNKILHVHGGIAFDDHVLPAVKKALRRVARGDSIHPAVRHCLDIDNFNPDKEHDFDKGIYGWGNYAVKDLRRSEKRGLGSPLVCCRSLNQRARSLHAQLQGLQLKNRERSSISASKLSLATTYPQLSC